MAAAGLLEAWQQRQAIFGTSADATATIVGVVTATLVGYASIRWLLRLLQLCLLLLQLVKRISFNHSLQMHRRACSWGMQGEE